MEIRCKNCGGRIVFEEGALSATCDSCGISQFIFDYLDKDSEDYDEQVEIIKSEKDAFENLYSEYADDIINADRYCLSSSDFLKRIAFFEKCGEYKNSQKLLALAKLCFIGKVSTLSDCFLAFKFIEEASDLTYDEKEKYKQAISDLAVSFAVIELDQKGFVTILPEKASAENILGVLKKLFYAKDKSTDSLCALETEIVNQRLNEAFAYVQTNCVSAVEACTDITILRDLKLFIPNIREKYCELGLWDAEEIIAKRIETVEAQNQLIEQQKIQAENERREKEKQRIRKSYIILGSIVLIIAFFAFWWASGYSHSKVEVAVVSKTNDTFNENLTDGHYQAGYFYVFGFEVENNSQHDIKRIGGTMEIFNANGESLAVSNVELQGKLKGNSTGHWNMRLQVKKSVAARELWNSDLTELKITFRIKKIYFEDGTHKNYSNTKNEIIYPKN